MTSAHLELARPDGTRLFVHAYRAASPRALLLVVHGMAEHGGRYARFAERANAAGFSVFAPDLRGHGRTAESDADLGHMHDRDPFGATLDDLEALLAHLRAEEGPLPVAILGHSMGSFLTQALLARAPQVSAVVLSGSTGKPPAIAHLGRLVARIERLRLGARGKSPLLHALSFQSYNKAFAPNRTEADWLSRDEAEVDRYVADPFAGFECSTATWIGILDALPRRLAPENLARWPKVPIHIVSGDADGVGENGKGPRNLLGTLREASLDATLTLYPGGRHEMLNETNRDEVESSIVDFLSRSLS